MIRKLQAAALPVYRSGDKSVIPPMVAIRIGAGEDIFIKGVINGGVSVSYAPPLLKDGRYALISIGFTVYETEPYDAETVAKLGSFRGISQAFVDEITYKANQRT